MRDKAPTPEQMDELLRFLPLFEQPGRTFMERWAGGEPTGDGAVTTRYPVYPEEVVAFFLLAGQTIWSDFDYKPAEARAMLEDDALVESATLDEIKTMLTYCVRGERFCDGHWAAVLESGRVQALLRRLKALRASVEE